jgi:hypothetical protein
MTSSGAGLEAAPTNAPVVREHTHEEQPASAFAVCVDGVVRPWLHRMGTAALVGHLQAQPQTDQPQLAADLLARGVTYGVGEEFGDQQLRVVACLFVDVPLVEPVEDSSTSARHRRVEGREAERVPERACRHS